MLMSGFGCLKENRKILKEFVLLNINMEIKVLEENKEKIVLEVIGEDHTLLNLIRDELWQDKDVEVAGYHIDHPLVSNPVLTIETNGKESAKKALQSCLDRLKKKNKEFLEKLKAMEKWA